MDGAALTMDYLINKIEGNQGRKVAALFLFLLVIYSSIPAFAPIGADPGHDMTFHLYRILGLAEGLREGQFPVRIQYSQLNGMGYPVSIFYGDFFLYFPALLVILGISVTGAYKAYLVIINLFVVFCTYTFAYRFSRSRLISYAISSVWTLGSYRLVDLYLRGAVGEYTALAFFPLLAYGMWCAFSSRGRKTTQLPPLALLSVGMTGIVLSHAISVLLAFLCLVGILVGLLICGDRKREGLVALCGALVLATGLCAYFVGPFFEGYILDDLQIKGGDGTPSLAQSSVSTLGQLLMIFPTMHGGDLPLEMGTAGEMPQAIGGATIGLLIVFTLAWTVSSTSRCERVDGNQKKIATVTTELWSIPWGIIIPLIILVCHCCLPIAWNEKLPWISMLSLIQFPWRLLGPVLFLSCLAGLYGLLSLNHSSLRNLSCVLALAISTFAFVEGGYMMSSAMNTVPVQTPISSHDSTNQHVAASVSRAEYLPSSANLEEVYYLAISLLDEEYVGDGFSLTHQASNGREFVVEFDAGVQDAVLPLLYYPYYEITSKESEGYISETENGLIRISVTGASTSNTELRFKFVPPAHWMFYNLISMLSLSFLVVFMIFFKVFLRKKDVSGAHRHLKIR